MEAKDQKLVEYMLNNEEQDNQKAFSAGWDEALKSQWISVGDRFPPKDVEVLVIIDLEGLKFVKNYRYRGGDDWFYAGFANIIAWMPIPSFDDILEANKDVLNRLKNK